MNNLFVNDNDEFIVNFFVAVDKEGTIFCDINEESLLKSMIGLTKKEDCSFNSYTAKFKKPSFGDAISLYNSIFSESDKQSLPFNPLMARYNIIVDLIKEWNLTEDKTFKKPTADEIKKLHPIIASAIGIQLDVELGSILS